MTDNGNILAHFLEVAVSAGDKPFLVEGERTVLSFANLDARTGRLASRLPAIRNASGDIPHSRTSSRAVFWSASTRCGPMIDASSSTAASSVSPPSLIQVAPVSPASLRLDVTIVRQPGRSAASVRTSSSVLAPSSTSSSRLPASNDR